MFFFFVNNNNNENDIKRSRNMYKKINKVKKSLSSETLDSRSDAN
jgi:hypothetical protein